MHGTGVRGPAFTAALEALRRGLGRLRPDLRLTPCDWGSALGSYLRADGASIPDFAAGNSSSVTTPAAEDEERARWAMLYADPLSELRLFTLTAGGAASPAAEFMPGRVPAGQQIEALLASVTEAETVRTAWTVAGLPHPLQDAITAVAASPELLDAAACADSMPDAERGALARLAARAVVAGALTRTEAGPGLVPPQTRDQLVHTLTDALGGDPRGLARPLVSALARSARLLERTIGSRVIVSRRASLSGRSVGFFGDVMRYLVRGETVRAYLADVLRGLPRPVVLLGHSLGGIIAFDLLASGVLGPTRFRPHERPDPPAVDLLVTVGSQAPLLYELDALPSRPYGTGLPVGFPPWVNIYDRRDLLSYVAGGIFGEHVRDVEVDNGQPVSTAHSSYWVNDDFYRVLSEALPGARPDAC